MTQVGVLVRAVYQDIVEEDQDELAKQMLEDTVQFCLECRGSV